MPSGPQVEALERRLSVYMQAAREHQTERVGARPDLTIAQATSPQIKAAIVSHTTVTFYRLGNADLRVVRAAVPGAADAPSLGSRAKITLGLADE